jgi:hypothetical protein
MKDWRLLIVAFGTLVAFSRYPPLPNAPPPIAGTFAQQDADWADIVSSRFPAGSSAGDLRVTLKKEGFRVYQTRDSISKAEGFLAARAWNRDGCGGYVEMRWRESAAGELSHLRSMRTRWCE